VDVQSASDATVIAGSAGNELEKDQTYEGRIAPRSRTASTSRFVNKVTGEEVERICSTLTVSLSPAIRRQHHYPKFRNHPHPGLRFCAIACRLARQSARHAAPPFCFTAAAAVPAPSRSRLRLQSTNPFPWWDYSRGSRRWPGGNLRRSCGFDGGGGVVAAATNGVALRQFLPLTIHSTSNVTFNHAQNSLPTGCRHSPLGSVAAPSFRCRSRMTGPVCWGPRHARFGQSTTPRPPWSRILCWQGFQDFGSSLCTVFRVARPAPVEILLAHFPWFFW